MPATVAVAWEVPAVLVALTSGGVAMPSTAVGTATERPVYAGPKRGLAAPVSSVNAALTPSIGLPTASLAMTESRAANRSWRGDDRDVVPGIGATLAPAPSTLVIRS